MIEENIYICNNFVCFQIHFLWPNEILRSVYHVLRAAYMIKYTIILQDIKNFNS